MVLRKRLLNFVRHDGVPYEEQIFQGGMKDSVTDLWQGTHLLRMILVSSSGTRYPDVVSL